MAPDNADIEVLSLQSDWQLTILEDRSVLEDCVPRGGDASVQQAELLTELDFTPPFRVVELP
jgi:hypothetical protein